MGRDGREEGGLWYRQLLHHLQHVHLQPSIHLHTQFTCTRSWITTVSSSTSSTRARLRVLGTAAALPSLLPPTTLSARSAPTALLPLSHSLPSPSLPSPSLPQLVGDDAATRLRTIVMNLARQVGQRFSVSDQRWMHGKQNAWAHPEMMPSSSKPSSSSRQIPHWTMPLAAQRLRMHRPCAHAQPIALPHLS